jgi:hypothetical protein
VAFAQPPDPRATPGTSLPRPLRASMTKDELSGEYPGLGLLFPFAVAVATALMLTSEEHEWLEVDLTNIDVLNMWQPVVLMATEALKIMFQAQIEDDHGPIENSFAIKYSKLWYKFFNATYNESGCFRWCNIIPNNDNMGRWRHDGIPQKHALHHWPSAERLWFGR